MSQPAKSLTEISDILNNIKYRDWQIVLGIKGDMMYLQVQFDGKCSVTGREERQYCRKWLVSPFMQENELVRTAFKAVEAAELHELEEHFRYKGRSIYSPHFKVDALIELCDREAYEVRA